MRIFYDRFSCYFVTESDLNRYAPPERYYEILPNNEDCYIEEWYCDNDRYVDLSYTKEDYENVNTIREIKEKVLNVNFLYMVSYRVPRKRFDEIIDVHKKIFYLQKINELEKALDKACSKLSTVIDIDGCNGFCECGLDGCDDRDCSNKNWWKYWCMKDE